MYIFGFWQLPLWEWLYQHRLRSENLSSVTKSRILKAGVATVMGQDPGMIRIDRHTNGVVYLSHVRNNEGSLWSYKCKIDGSLIIWGAEAGR